MGRKTLQAPTRGLLIGAGLMCCLYVAYQARFFPPVFLMWPINLAVEIAMGVAMISLIVGVLRRLIAPRAVAVVAVLLIAGAGYLLNWSVIAPRAYFALHRPAFDQVAALVRAGTLGDDDEYYGERMPPALAHVSADGRAAAVSIRDEGEPVAVFLPQWFGIPDDAGGFVYYEAEPPPDMLVDLYGRGVVLAEAQPLGGGWWWTG